MKEADGVAEALEEGGVSEGGPAGGECEAC